MPRWFKITLWAALGLCVAGFAAVQYILWDISNTEWNFTGSSDSHWEARAEFMDSLSGAQCLTREAIFAAAQEREFVHWVLENDLRWCHRPVGLTDWVGVEVMPGQMMSTLDENSEYFGFDQNGCAVPWESASGQGTTCP